MHVKIKLYYLTSVFLLYISFEEHEVLCSCKSCSTILSCNPLLCTSRTSHWSPDFPRLPWSWRLLTDPQTVHWPPGLSIDLGLLIDSNFPLSPKKLPIDSQIPPPHWLIGLPIDHGHPISPTWHPIDTTPYWPQKFPLTPKLSIDPQTSHGQFSLKENIFSHSKSITHFNIQN